ncbi:MAG: glycosyltransferase [Thermoleophilia bacterium]
MEIDALQAAGAHVRLLTSNKCAKDAPSDLPQTLEPLLDDGWTTGSSLRWRPARVAHNLVRMTLYRVLIRSFPQALTHRRRHALAQLVDQVDLFWVIDFPSLPSVMDAIADTDVRVVYETVDLVPEYMPNRRLQLARERNLVGRVDGFITACDSYADYYMERYHKHLRRRPVVRDNMPAKQVAECGVTNQPLRFLFLGSLMFDRPITELIEAMALTTMPCTLDFQGKNLIGEEPLRRIEELGLQDRVHIVASCPADQTVSTSAAYDVGIVALRGNDENERRASTSKLFTYMSAGLAILGSGLPGIARVVTRFENGLLVGSMRSDDWAAAIDTMCHMQPSAIDALRSRSLEGARHHSWTTQRPAFVDEFHQALTPRANQCYEG